MSSQARRSSYLLAPDAPKARIKSDLQAFDPIQLLFLRRLRTAEVSVDGQVVKVIREDFEEFQGYNGEVRRITVSKPGSQTQIVTNYMIVRNKIKVTHGSSKRVGIQETEVALGFPFTSDSPVIHPQNAHNFLPIRKTSFFVSIPVVGSSNTKNLLTSHSFSSMLTSSWLPIGKIWMSCMRNGITCSSELQLRPSPWQLSASRILRSVLLDSFPTSCQRAVRCPFNASTVNSTMSPRSLYSEPEKKRSSAWFRSDIHPSNIQNR
jgi:hypothetical protein